MYIEKKLHIKIDKKKQCTYISVGPNVDKNHVGVARVQSKSIVT